MTRSMLFRRQFLGYSGGHGKVWDYFRHAQAHSGWDACIHFTRDSIDEGNPWRDAGEPEVDEWRPRDADAIFIAGMDWLCHPEDSRDRPVINLIQGVHHADHGQPLREFLTRPAIRICVGQPVADAITATGLLRGPCLVVDSGLDLGKVSEPAGATIDVFVAAQKQPLLGEDVAQCLRSEGIVVDCAASWLPRSEFLARMRRARVVIALPLQREGFYLPGLEAMASSCAVVMPDAIGNRAYADPGLNALMPLMEVDAIVSATREILFDASLYRSLVQAGTATAARHTLGRERAAFHRILDNLEPLWAHAWAATLH